MAGIYGNSAEDRAHAAALHDHLDNNFFDTEAIAKLGEEFYREALHNSAEFETLEHDYEIVSKYHDQIQRALRNLDDAIAGNQASQDAVYTALHIIQNNLQRLCYERAEAQIRSL